MNIPFATGPLRGALLGMSIAVGAYVVMNAASVMTLKGYLADDPRIAIVDTTKIPSTNRKNIDDVSMNNTIRHQKKVAALQKEIVSSSVTSVVQAGGSSSLGEVIKEGISSLKTEQESTQELHSAATKKYSRRAVQKELLQASLKEHSGAPLNPVVTPPITPEEQYKGKGKKGVNIPITPVITPITQDPIIHEVRVPVEIPPKVITREIKVPTPQKTIIREVRVPVETPPKVVTITTPEPVEHLTDSGAGLNISISLALFLAFLMVRRERGNNLTTTTVNVEKYIS